MNRTITTAMILTGALGLAGCAPKTETPAAAPAASTAPATDSGAMPSAAAPAADQAAPASGAAAAPKNASQGGGDKI